MTERKFTADEIAVHVRHGRHGSLSENGDPNYIWEVIELTLAQREAVAEALNQPEWVRELGRAKEAWPALCDILLGADNPGEVVDGINMFSAATGWGKPKLLCD